MADALIPLLCVALLAVAPVPDGGAVTGRWNASVTIAAGPVAFGLDLNEAGGRVTGAILNGEDRLELSSGTWDGAVLTLRLDQYDGTIVARQDGEAGWTGEYTRQTRSGIGRYPFRAVRAAATAAPLPDGWEPPLLAGDWAIEVYGSDGKLEERGDAVFTIGEPTGSGRRRLTGTVIPVSGDYGLLAGELIRGPHSVHFSLSRFDGIHAVRLDGEVHGPDEMRGTLGSGLTHTATWTAIRKKAAAASVEDEAYTLTRMRDPEEPLRFTAKDLGGATVSFDDARFKGKVVLVDIFGTWCPNCHDEAPLLVELHKKYRDRGFEVIGLAYEYTSEWDRSVRLIERFRARYGIEFPLLVAGTTADGEIARTLPQLVGFGAYPTTLFVGRDGRVRAIHAGYSGPATGARHEQVKAEFEERVRRLLAESN
jgi:thiol-disulfide isomerase/thioredoxin